MKKVVLLAGALAAGMAIAPQTANAAAPETNGIQEVNREDKPIEDAIADANMQISILEKIQNAPGYATVTTADQKAIQNAIDDLKALVTEMTYVIDGNPLTNSDYFYNTNIGHDQGDLSVDPSTTSADFIKRYAGSNPNNCMEVVSAAIAAVEANVTAAQAALVAYAGTMTPADIQAKNTAVETNVKATDEYQHLVDLLNEANDILKGNDPLYKDADTYDELKDKEFDAHLKDGAMVSSKNLLDKIEGASDVDTELISEYELMVDLSTVTPELEGLISTFKKHANEEAAKKVQAYVQTEQGKIDTIISNLQHHLNTKATCFDAANHVIAENADVVADKAQLATDLTTIEPDDTWNNLGHSATDPAQDRVLNDPAAVQMWYDIQQGNPNTIDAHLTNLETAVYTACLTYDSEDIKAALDELAGTGYTADLNDGTTEKGTAVDSDLQDWLDTYFSDTAEAGTLAKEWFDLDDDFTNNLFMGDISAADFATAEAKVDALEKTIANLKANWTDIESLNDDLVDLKVDLKDATEKDGYDSAYIKDQWENATNGEGKHYTDLLADVETAIDNVTDVETSWVGADEFADEIALENDHHDWLAEYQKENYDAKQDMLAAIDVRKKELDTVTTFAITSDDPEAPMTLADGTELYTTDTNKDRALAIIKGEDNTSKFIYQDKFFNELREHFYNGADGTLETTPVYVTDGNPIDLKNDQILAWYNDGDAQYIVKKTYDATWKAENAKREGELINNTVEGLQITTSTLSATGILVMNPEVTTEGNEVVFGWLQKEIQNAFAKAVENEKANKDLHDQIDACEDYVQDAKDDIDNYAKFTLSHLEQKLDVYSLSDRKTAPVTRGNQSWDLDILYPGTTSGVPSLDPVALPAEYKTKEDATVITLAAGAHDYNNVFNCGHENGVWGWTKIATEITALWNLEKQEYDKVASKALLDAKTVENKITEIEENVDDIKNEAYTRIIKNGFARVHNSINEARAWAASVDGVCHEDGLKPCSTEDVKNNPCGWDDPVASKALADLIDFYNEKLTLLGTEHKAENNDDHETPVVDEDNIKEFADYLNQMYVDLNAWTVKFVAADTKHKKALNDALDLAGEEAHALHHYSYDANQALINYNDAEKAAVNLWAVDFSKRKIGTFDGEKVTFQEFVKKIDDKMIADGAVDHTLDPDVYAAIKKFAAEPIANFQDYIDATEKLEGFIKAVAQVYYKHHQYTELKKLADGTKNFNWDADFQKAVDANNAAHVELLKQHAQAQATLDAAKNDVIADKNEVYPVDYTTLTTTALQEAQDVLDAQKTNIENKWKEGKAADYSANGNEDGVLEVKGYALDLTKDGKNVIDAYVAKAQAAKDLYAANKVAKEELLVQIQAILTNTNSAYEEVECAETAGCTQDFRTDLNNLKKDLVGVDGNGGIKKEVNDGFAAKFADKTAAELKADVDALETKLGQVKKDIAEFNHKVLASADAKADILDKIEKAFGTEGSLMKPALAETGAENFKHVPATGEVRNTAKYFDEINAEIDDLKTTITNDDSHAGNHSALEKYNTYLQTLAGIKADLEELVQAIKDNEQAHKDQLQHRDELYKKYECYDTTGLEAAVNGIADPDFSLDTEFPEVPGYPETAVDPAGKDHTKAHTAVAEAIKALDAEIKKHYENGASNMDDAKTLIGEKETEYTTAFEHAQTNDSKFMEEYGKCTEAAKAVKYTYENWQADHFENGANKFSDEADVQVTKAYNEMVAAQKAYLADIKTDWYKNEAVEKVANNEGLLNTYKEKINAYNAAVEKAQTNDQEFDKQYAAHVEKPLTAEATYTDTRVVADPVYVTLQAQLTALLPECDNAKFVDIRNQIIQDWEDEKSALNGTAEAVAAYQAAAKKYNELMDNLNAYGSQLVKYLKQSDAFNDAKTTIAGYDIMTPDYKDFDGNTEGAEDYNHKKDIEDAISNIDGKLNTLYSDMKTEAEHVAETINDADLTNNEVNDLYVDPAVGTIKTLIENLVKDAKKYEDACDANEAAFEPLHDNIKAVEADYAEDSAKVTALPEPAQEAFILAVKEDLEALAELQKELEEAYMDEDAVNFTKDNTDYEDLKKEIEEMYARAEEAGAHLGDIDFNGDVTVYDSDALVDIVLYNRGYAVRGDFDFNGENDVTDVERLNNLLWYEHIEKAWAPGRVAFEGDIELTAEGNTVALALNNNVKTNGIQFDITVPEGAYIQNVLGTDRVEGMRVLTACIADNTYRVLVISTLNASTINDNEGAIVTFNVCGGNEVEVSNVIATDGKSHRLNGAAVSVGVTTDIQEIATEGETDIFSLDGIRQSVMKAGVNIVRGANGVAKKIFNK